MIRFERNVAVISSRMSNYPQAPSQTRTYTVLELLFSPRLVLTNQRLNNLTE